MKVACGVCSGVFKNVNELKVHFRRHKERKFKCHLCALLFFKVSTLAKHLAIIHLKKKGVNFKKISDLEGNFDNALLYNQEEKMHAHNKIQLFQCELCAKRFKSKSNLMQHRKFHLKQKDHECLLCQHKFYTTSHLKAHLKIHNNERNYKCDLCNKTFIHSSSFKKHQNFHNNTKNFHCKICGKSFSQSCHLREHDRTHTDERPYKCLAEECGRSFKRLDNLVHHQKTHTR